MKPHTTLALVAIVAAISLAGCQLKEDSMDYFQNESEVMIIKGENHDLNIENRLDRVSLYGSVDITHDAAGLALMQNCLNSRAAPYNLHRPQTHRNHPLKQHSWRCLTATYPQPKAPFPLFLLFLLVSKGEFPFKISILTDLKVTF
jgi:hypothetical protein